MKKAFAKSVACYVIAGFFLMSIVPRVDAAFFPSEMIPSSQQNAGLDLQHIRKTLETKMIRERLNQLGFSEDEIQVKLSNLDDQQLHQVALSIDDLKTAGNGFEVLVILFLIAILIGVWFHVSGKRLVVQ